jgi:predicted N-formylglutamate amidohydrolase
MPMPEYQIHAPESLSEILITCEHASNRLPFRRGVGRIQRRILDSHWGWDVGAWELSLDLTRRLDAGVIGGRWSRLLLDLNRRADDPTLLRQWAGDVELPWNVSLDPAAVEDRVTRYHTPYHVELDRLILRRLVRGVRPLLFAVHSFTPCLNGRERGFEIGVLYEHHPGPAHRLGRALRKAGLTVRYNRPYSGMAGMMYAVDRHGSHHGLTCIELEVNHEILRSPAAVRRLGKLVAPAVQELLRETGKRSSKRRA